MRYYRNESRQQPLHSLTVRYRMRLSCCIEYALKDLKERMLILDKLFTAVFFLGSPRNYAAISELPRIFAFYIVSAMYHVYKDNEKHTRAGPRCQ